MKLDELRRMSGSGASLSTAESREQLRSELAAGGIDWSNIYQELEMSHRFVDTHQDESTGGESVPLHSHSFYELLFCRSNSGIEYLLGTSRYRLQRGDLLFIAPGVSHRPLIAQTLIEPYRRDVIWMSGEFVSKIQSAFNLAELVLWESAFLLRTAGTPCEVLGEHIHAGVLEAQRRAPGWEAYVAGNTMMIATLATRALLERDGVVLAQAEKPELLDLVFAYIEAHLNEPITLADTAHHFWVSESTISQVFRQRLGVSFYRCVTQRRLIAAKSLITQGVPLNTVNERVGFADYSTFFRAFKREYGISPSQFRFFTRQRGEEAAVERG